MKTLATVLVTFFCTLACGDSNFVRESRLMLNEIQGIDGSTLSRVTRHMGAYSYKLEANLQTLGRKIEVQSRQFSRYL